MTKPWSYLRDKMSPESKHKAQEMMYELKLLEELRSVKMAIDKLTASIAALKTAVDAFIAQSANSVPQAQVDAAQTSVDAITAEVNAVLTPV